jgi:hypothetical protein
MALSILDGNQSATTLSTILSSGQHITAHTVVSLGTQAITDMQSAVSGSVVSISNLPSTQTIAGTVTVGQIQGYQHTTAGTSGPYNADVILVGEDIESSKAGGLVVIPAARDGGVLGGRTSQGDAPICVYGDNGGAVTISGTVTANPTGTQTIAGTVTANGGTILVKRTDGGAVTVGYLPIGDSSWSGQSGAVVVMGGADDGAVPVHLTSVAGLSLEQVTGSLPISGTVTIGSALPAGTNRIGVVTIGNIQRAGDSVQSSLLTEVGSGYLLNRSYLGAGLEQIGSVTASISGTIPISISSVTVGNSVTIASLPTISGTVTANTFALQGTAVTTSNFTSTTASTVLANFNATREVLTIFNEGAGNLHICAGATCTTIAYQVRLSAGDYYEVPNHQTSLTHSAVFATAGTARICQVS